MDQSQQPSTISSVPYQTAVRFHGLLTKIQRFRQFPYWLHSPPPCGKEGKISPWQKPTAVWLVWWSVQVGPDLYPTHFVRCMVFFCSFREDIWVSIFTVGFDTFCTLSSVRGVAQIQRYQQCLLAKQLKVIDCTIVSC